MGGFKPDDSVNQLIVEAEPLIRSVSLEEVVDVGR